MANQFNRILVIDEGNSLESELVPGLSKAGFSTAFVPSLANAFLAFQVFNPDMVILRHRSEDSLEMCHQLHDSFHIPIILLGEDYGDKH